MPENDIIDQDVNIIEAQPDVNMAETVEVVNVSASEMLIVDSSNAFPALGAGNGDLKHQLLNGRELSDQHPITSITGLREELDNIEELQTIYSNERNHANYYLWDDKNQLQEDRVGYFVSVRSDINQIKICTKGNNIFGVTVDNAGFIGAQANIERDIKYGLVVTNGVVHVRCELSVKVGDYVVSNDYGYAKTNTTGYKVVGRHKIDGVEYAEIILVTPIERMCEISDNVDELNIRMDTAEINIVAAMNLANDAYQKASESNKNSAEANKNASDAKNKVNQMSDDYIINNQKINEQIAESKKLSAEAQVIANSAISSALVMRDEAIKKANQALDDASKLRDEFNELSQNMDSNLSGAVGELKDSVQDLEEAADGMKDTIDGAVDELRNLKEDMKPLATWSKFYECKLEAKITKGEKYYFVINDKKYTFTSPADADSSKTIEYNVAKKTITVGTSTTKAKVVEDVTGMTELEFVPSGDRQSFAGFVAEADKNGAELASMVEWKDGNDENSFAGMVQKATEDNATISAIAGYEKMKDYSPSTYYRPNDYTHNGITYKVDENKYITVEGTATADSHFALVTTGNPKAIPKNSVLRVTGCPNDGSESTYYLRVTIGETMYYDCGDGIDIQTGDNDSYSSIIQIKQGTTVNNLIFKPKFKIIDSVGAAGLISEVDELGSKVDVIANYTHTDENGDTIEGISGLTAQVLANKASIDLLSKLEGGDFDSLAGMSTQVTKNKADLEALASYQAKDKNGNPIYSVAGIMAHADKNSAEVSQLANHNFTDENNNPVSGAAGVVARVKANKSEISAIANHTFTKKDGTTVKGLAGLNAYVKENESNISLVANRVAGEYTVIDELPEDTSKRDTSKVYHSGTATYWYYDKGKWESIETFSELVKYKTMDQKMVYYAGGTYQKYLYYDETLQWKSTDDPATAGLPSAIAGIQAVADDHSSRINSLTSWQGETNTSITNIEQKADDNGAYIQTLTADVAMYGFGQHSQADGLTLDQAKGILVKGMVFVPTADFKETYSTTTTQFTPGYAYTWDGEKWNESKSVCVNRSDTYSKGTANTPYWYLPSGKSVTHNGVKYKDYTLYLWKNNRWIAVASSSENRKIALIRQTANSIEASVTSVDKKYAGTKTWVDNNKSAIQDTVSWYNENKEYNLATIKATADNAGASIAQVASRVSGCVIVDKWSETGKKTKKIYFNKDNEKYYYYKDSKWKSTTDPSVAGALITAASIVTAINDSGDSSIALSADHIIIDGKLTANGNAGFTEEGGLFAKAGEIAGWQIRTKILAKTIDLGDGTTRTTGFQTPDSGAWAITVNASDFGDWSTGTFRVSHKGKMYAENAEVKGKIIATSGSFQGTINPDSGEIGGWNIAATGLQYRVGNTLTMFLSGTGSQSNNYKVGNSGDRKDWSIWSNEKFGVTKEGKLYSVSGNIGGWNIASNGLQYLNSSGTLKMFLSGTGVQSGTYTVGSHSGKDWLMWADGKFGVTNAGKLYASSAEISGKITATSGTIGGCSISSGTLKIGSANITSLDVSKLKAGNSNIKFETYLDGTAMRIYTTDNNRYFSMGHMGNSMGIGISANCQGLYSSGYSDNIYLGRHTYTEDPYSMTISSICGKLQGNWHMPKGSYLYFGDKGYIYHSTTYSDRLVFHINDGCQGRLYGEWIKPDWVSDVRVKNSIEDLSEKYELLFNALQPKRYKYNDGTSNRYHTGYIAQEVVQSIEESGLTTLDFAGVCIPKDENEDWYLRRDEFVALNTWQIQKAKARITELENRVAQLEALIKE